MTMFLPFTLYHVRNERRFGQKCSSASRTIENLCC